MRTQAVAPRHREPREALPLFPAGEWVCLVLGAVLVLLGGLGFVPGITDQYDTLTETPSQATLLGVFRVSVLYNVIHLVSGTAALAAAWRVRPTRRYLGVAGLIYLGLWIYGFVPVGGTGRDLMPLNEANIWLYCGLGFVMLATLMFSFGAVAKPSRSSRSEGGEQ